MKKEVLILLLNDFADWEAAFIAPVLNKGLEPGRESKYVVKTVSVSMEPVLSIGGFRMLPDYDIHSVPGDYAGIILIGGMQWFSPDAELFLPLVEESMKQNRMVAGICNGSVFLAKHGFLNEAKHTSNDLNYLKYFAGNAYNGEASYINEPAVRDRNLITANGLSSLEFCREILYALQADAPGIIEKHYRMNKTGVWEAPEGMTV